MQIQRFIQSIKNNVQNCIKIKLTWHVLMTVVISSNYNLFDKFVLR